MTARPGSALELRLRSVHWERIQLVVRLAGEQPPLALVHEDASQERMPATRQWTEDGDTLARFNVMQGPDAQPMNPGRWHLGTLAGQHGHWPAVDVADGADPAFPERQFRLRVRTLRVAPSLDAAQRALVVDVALDESTVPGYDPVDPSRAYRVRAWLRRRQRKVRRRISRAVVAVFRWLHRGKRGRVLFVSRLSPVLAGNLKTVHDRMVERGLDREFELVKILKKDLTSSLGWLDRLRLLRGLATAEVIFLDDSFGPVYWIDFPPEVHIVQLWHASGAFKTVGYSRAGKREEDAALFLNPYGRIHKNYTHVIVSSEFDVPFYAEALGVPEDRVFATGIPRMDRFFRPEAKAAAEREALETFPIIRGRKVWMFAPTYRSDVVATAYFDDHLLDYAALHALAVERDAAVIFKMHPFVRKELDIPPEFADRLVDATRTKMDVNDLLFVVDLLITDYSSIIFEFSVLNRPMLFFAYDLEEYLEGRDLYVPFEELVPGRIVRTFPELLDAIRRDDYEFEKVNDFAHAHFAHLDGDSTDRVIDLAIGR